MHIVITWPKSRSLESYLAELDKAEREGLLINYRLPTRLLRRDLERCYVVHDGAIRGWNEILSVDWKEDGMVKDPTTDAFWPAGCYIVRDPHWNPIDPVPMKGFRGFRYCERIATDV